MSRYSVAALQHRYGSRWRWYALLTVMVTTMATVLSATSINVALADIMVTFNLSQGEVHWLATGYLAAMTVSMLCATWVLDHVGIRRATLISVLLFSVASVVGGLSQHTGQLLVSRLVLGALAGLMQPMSIFLVFRVFPPQQRGTVLGFYGFGIVLAPALGPVIGGFLVDYFSWRYVFYAPVPVTLMAAVLAWYFLPVKGPREQRYRFDFVGCALLSAVLVISLYMLNDLQYHPLWTARSIILLGLSLVSLVAFVVYERWVAHPLLNLALLFRRQFLYASCGALGLGLTMYGTTYLIPVFSQTALAYTPTDAGLLMLPAGVVLGATLLLGSRLTDIMLSRNLLLAGMVLVVVSALFFSQSAVGTSFVYLATCAVVSRLGMGLLLPSVSTGALNQLSPDELSDGSATISFVRQVGGAYGINIIALLITKTEGVSAQLLPLSEFSIAWLFMAVALIAMLLPVSRLRN
ncbi:DHA2 family efflux MFS transporter permease subunit [Marinobacter sp. X15-166B]|uniref:DHA2 family efflux MFS transporter permease subunit n=1 Tax=Marinobacter sp. X15-166B TaxID=1897620 RepID=UPI00085BBA13|nr:DHA2 family efflux MFS transporter permease subunit [Marinobacter sp. X15-166B]OEY67943.1 hypothetical protein BG841_06395 [Marinobacter sp. X15-166B]